MAHPISTNNSVKYRICTNLNLFHQYARVCEPIKIKFTSAISNLQIGTVYVTVPLSIVSFFKLDYTNKNSQKSIEQKDTYNIFSPKNNILGNVIINISVNLFENHINRPIMVPPITLNIRQDAENEIRSIPSANTVRSANFDKIICLSKDSKTKNFESLVLTPHKKPYVSLGTLSFKSKSHSINYLNGRNMTRIQDLKALKKIKSVSPTGSLINALSNDIIKPTISVSTIYKIDQQLIKQINSIKIGVSYLALSSAGVKEIRSSDKSGIFIIECRPNISLFDIRGGVKYKFDFEKVWFISNNLNNFNSSK